MKIKETLFGVIAALMFVGGPANAEAPLHFKEGIPFGYTIASFCKDKESIISILKDFEENGMASSIQVYRDLIAEEKCVLDNRGGSFIPVSLFYEYNNAIGLEVLKEGVTTFFLSSDAEFFPKGEPI